MIEHQRNKPPHKPRRGEGSYLMQDADAVFAAMGLAEGDWFLDAGCGPGDYSLHAARMVGESGRVFALEIDETLVGSLAEKAESLGLSNIEAIAADLTRPLPVPDGRFAVCLLSTVLHIPAVTRATDRLCREIRRALTDEGVLAILECSDKDLSFGPPADMRLSPDEVKASVEPHGFTMRSLTYLGFNYLIQFTPA